MLAIPLYAVGGVRTKAVKEAAEYVTSKFGREATEEFGEGATHVVAKRIETLAAKHGEEVVVEATKKVGPRVFRLVEEVGEDGAPRALKLMARQGDEAVWVVARPKSFALFAKYGDNAADAMIRHQEIAEALIENYGTPMTNALVGVNGQSARRLAMLADEGTLTKISQRDALLETVGKYGDKAMDWVWRNKAAITTVAVVAAFVANPEPFIYGAVEVVAIGSEHVVRPVAESAAKSINWNFFAGVVAVSLMLLVATRMILRRTRLTGSHASTRHPALRSFINLRSSA